MGRYIIYDLIGQGGYGDIYKCKDLETKKWYALKVESTTLRKQALQREIVFMKTLDSPYFPKLIRYEENIEYRFLAMELCGTSLSAVRRAMPGHKFSISTVIRVGIEMLRAIAAIHKHGILHRDIKPSNFLMRPSRRYPLALTDYGLSKFYIDQETGEILPPRHRPGFVGTNKYASLAAHLGEELGRRDDLYSWFYSLIELWAGHLPWPSSRDKEKVYEAKRVTDISSEIKEMPPSMLCVYRLIRRLDRDEEPNYNLLISFMCKAMSECGATWQDKFDWEEYDLSEISALDLTIPDNEKPEIPVGLPEAVMPPREFKPFARNEELDMRLQSARRYHIKHRFG